MAVSLPGLAALAALLFTWMQVGQANKELRISEQGQITNRFNAAITNLGSDSLDVRLGGIYALERIMQDSTRDRATIVSVLTAYVRRHAPLPEKGSEKQPSPSPDATPATDIEAVMHVLAERPPAGDELVLDLSRTDLRGLTPGTGRSEFADADFRESDLSGADLSHANLAGADLDGAVLRTTDLSDASLLAAGLAGAVLSDALLTAANLTSADLESARLGGADLSGTYLNSTVLEKAVLQDANLTGAYLRSADLEDADLSGARLNSAELTLADLTGADLTGADLTGADLTGAILTDARLEGAKLDGVRGLSPSQR
ncbi:MULTISPECIES: pentapeptide repeat-containing protein [unclassified Streptomyces]|uniref:pentapeptide repeat-containing protein n=1 Tax=unclassified Streptomyces TaxID=2593676 RepID=UPI0013013328|nr:pentapeptide repeat-containing protein [Streptomyces sp. CB02058]